MVNPREMITSQADSQIQAHGTAEWLAHHSPVQTMRGLAKIYFRQTQYLRQEVGAFTTTRLGARPLSIVNRQVASPTFQTNSKCTDFQLGPDGGRYYFLSFFSAL